MFPGENLRFGEYPLPSPGSRINEDVAKLRLFRSRPNGEDAVVLGHPHKEAVAVHARAGDVGELGRGRNPISVQLLFRWKEKRKEKSGNDNQNVYNLTDARGYHSLPTSFRSKASSSPSENLRPQTPQTQ